jgi:hypothetical protein
MTDTPYGKRLRAAAQTDFRKFWSDYRWWLTIVGFFNLPIIIQLIHGEDTLIDWGLACIYALLSLILSLLGSYAIAMRRGAENLDSGHLTTIKKQDEELDVRASRIKELEKKPKRSLLEESQDELLKERFEKYGEEEKSVLNYLAMHQVIIRTDRSSAFPPISGVPRDKIWDILSKLHQDDMVSRNTDHSGNGWKETWTISLGAVYTLNQELRAKKS